MVRTNFKFDELEQLMDLAFIPAVIDEETGEILQEEQIDESLFEEAGELYYEKIEGCLLGVQRLTADANAIGEKIKVMQKRKKQKEDKAERLKAFLQRKLNGEHFESELVSVSYRSSQSVEVDPEAVATLPEELQTVKIDIKPNKAAIKKLLKAGKSVDGCTLIDNISMNIK